MKRSYLLHVDGRSSFFAIVCSSLLITPGCTQNAEPAPPLDTGSSPANGAPSLERDSLSILAKQAPSARHLLHLRSIALDDAALPALAWKPGHPTMPLHFLVPFHSDPTEARSSLERLGFRVERWLPDATFVVRRTLPPDAYTRTQLDALPGPLLPMQPEWKLAPEWLTLAPDQAEARALLHLFPGADRGRITARLAELGLPVVAVADKQFPRLALRGPAAELLGALRAVSELDDVFWIELRGEVRLLNTVAVPIHQGGSPTAARSLADEGLLGEGQVVAYLDTGLDVDSCFFRDPSGVAPVTNLSGGVAVGPDHRKVLAYNFLYAKDSPTSPTAWDSHGHGTHVGGNIGGDNLATLLVADEADGMAPGVKLVVQDGGYAVDNCGDLPGIGCPVVDLEPLFAQTYAQGARLHSDSWGDNENSAAQNTYSAGSEDADSFMWTHRDFQLLFAAGNSGPTSGTVGSPSTAKNVLAIGAVGNSSAYGSVSGFSSRGPTSDSRLKPDLLAVGTNTSADSDNTILTQNCGLDTGSGTSYASPLAAGAAALVREYLARGYLPDGVPASSAAMAPTSALLRAMLISSGVSIDSGRPFPTMDQGWGRIDLDSLLPFPGDLERLKLIDEGAGFMKTGDRPVTLNVQVMGSDVPLKVTLVWTDYPSSPAAATNLVNDLDLVVSNGGKTWLGNAFRRGESVAGGTPDGKNPIEQVYLTAPTPGNWTITVRATRIVTGPQPFAIVVRGNIQ